MQGKKIAGGQGTKRDHCGAGTHLNVVCADDAHQFGVCRQERHALSPDPCSEGGNLNACHTAEDLHGGGGGHGHNVCCGPGHLVTGGVGGCNPFAGCTGTTNFCGQGNLHA